MTVIDSIRSYIPSSVQNKARQVVAWGKVPISESPIYQGISNGTSNGLTKLAGKAGEIAVKNEGAQSFIGKMLGKAASYIAPAAESTKGFLGKMGGVAKGGGLFTKGNVAIASLFEASDIIEGFKEGRGIKQTIQSATKVGAGVAGGLAATAGAVSLGLLAGPVGWGALAIGVVGSAVGYMAGGKATNFLGHNKSKEEVAVAQKPAQFGSMTMPNGAINPAAFDLYNPLAGLPQLS